MTLPPDPAPDDKTPRSEPDISPKHEEKEQDIREIGGPKGAEPTRFGDWEKNGRCSDF